MVREKGLVVDGRRTRWTKDEMGVELNGCERGTSDEREKASTPSF